MGMLPLQRKLVVPPTLRISQNAPSPQTLYSNPVHLTRSCFVHSVDTGPELPSPLTPASLRGPPKPGYSPPSSLISLGVTDKSPVPGQPASGAGLQLSPCGLLPPPPHRPTASPFLFAVFLPCLSGLTAGLLRVRVFMPPSRPPFVLSRFLARLCLTVPTLLPLPPFPSSVVCRLLSRFSSPSG